MSQRIIFSDTFAYHGVPFLRDAQEYVRDTLKSQKKASLLVEADATFSGYFLNGRVYPGRHMAAAVPTWTSQARGGSAPYDKPVLLDHDQEHADATIGRVVSAHYTRLWDEAKWMDDWKTPVTGYNKGSGFTRLGMSISDPLAIEKFLDGRYSTFSTSFVSPNLRCSICGVDWMQTFPDTCEHVPGKVYEEDDGQATCFLIPGEMDWLESSVVTRPAQPFAVGEIVRMIGDAAKTQDVSKGLRFPTASLQDIDGVRCSLTLMDAEGNGVLLTGKPGGQDAIAMNGKLRPSSKVNIPFEAPSLPGDRELEDGTGNTSDAMEDEVFAFAHVAKSMHDAGLLGTDEELNVLYGMGIPEDSGLQPTFDECLDAALSLVDAKLSSDQRTKLKASTFCGPGRSFPVPDCAHVTAARKLIGRFKGSVSAKDRILDNVNKKAFQLGCGGSDSGQKQTTVSENPNMPDTTTPATPAAPVADPKAEERVAALADQIAELRREKQALQSDRDSKEADLRAAQDKVAKLTTDLHKANSELLATLRAVTMREADGLDSSDKLAAYATKLSERSPASITDALTDEKKVFAARIPHLKGLPNFVTEQERAAPATATRQTGADATAAATSPQKDKLDY